MDNEEALPWPIPREQQTLDSGAVVPAALCFWVDVEEHVAQRTDWVPRESKPKRYAPSVSTGYV